MAITSSKFNNNHKIKDTTKLVFELAIDIDF